MIFNLEVSILDIALLVSWVDVSPIKEQKTPNRLFSSDWLIGCQVTNLIELGRIREYI